MLNEREVLSKIASVSVFQLRIWVSEEWVRPARRGEDPVYNEADIARIRLVDLLHNQMQVNEEAIPIILSLIDQMHDLKEQMRLIASAISDQPDGVQRKILEAIREKPSRTT